MGTKFTVTVSYTRGLVMEWGGICLGDRTELLFSKISKTSSYFQINLLREEVILVIFSHCKYFVTAINYRK